MFASLAIARLTLRDLIGRGGIWLVIASVALMVLTSRWLAIWAFGEEVRLYKEFSLSSMGLGAALIAAFSAVPLKRRRAVLTAERVMLTKGLPTLSWCFGKALGMALLVIAAYLLWTACFGAGLWLFWIEERTLFSYTQNSTFGRQFIATLLPIFLVLLQSLVICAFAILVSSTGNLLVTISSVIALLLFATIVPDWAARDGGSTVGHAIALLLPDFRIGLARETLAFERANITWALASFLQLLGYGSAFLMLAAAIKRSDSKP